MARMALFAVSAVVLQVLLRSEYAVAQSTGPKPFDITDTLILSYSTPAQRDVILQQVLVIWRNALNEYQSSSVAVKFSSESAAASSGTATSSGGTGKRMQVTYHITGQSVLTVDTTKATAAFRQNLMDAHVTGAELMTDSTSGGGQVGDSQDSDSSDAGSSQQFSTTDTVILTYTSVSQRDQFLQQILSMWRNALNSYQATNVAISFVSESASTSQSSSSKTSSSSSKTVTYKITAQTSKTVDTDTVKTTVHQTITDSHLTGMQITTQTSDQSQSQGSDKNTGDDSGSDQDAGDKSQGTDSSAAAGTSSQYTTTDSVVLTYTSVTQRDQFLQQILSMWRNALNKYQATNVAISFVSETAASTERTSSAKTVIYQITATTSQTVSTETVKTTVRKTIRDSHLTGMSLPSPTDDQSQGSSDQGTDKDTTDDSQTTDAPTDTDSGNDQQTTGSPTDTGSGNSQQFSTTDTVVLTYTTVTQRTAFLNQILTFWKQALSSFKATNFAITFVSETKSTQSSSSKTVTYRVTAQTTQSVDTETVKTTVHQSIQTAHLTGIQTTTQTGSDTGSSDQTADADRQNRKQDDTSESDESNTDQDNTDQGSTDTTNNSTTGTDDTSSSTGSSQQFSTTDSVVITYTTVQQRTTFLQQILTFWKKALASYQATNFAITFVSETAGQTSTSKVVTYRITAQTTKTVNTQTVKSTVTKSIQTAHITSIQTTTQSGTTGQGNTDQDNGQNTQDQTGTGSTQTQDDTSAGSSDSGTDASTNTGTGSSKQGTQNTQGQTSGKTTQNNGQERSDTGSASSQDDSSADSSDSSTDAPTNTGTGSSNQGTQNTQGQASGKNTQTNSRKQPATGSTPAPDDSLADFIDTAAGMLSDAGTGSGQGTQNTQGQTTGQKTTSTGQDQSGTGSTDNSNTSSNDNSGNGNGQTQTITDTLPLEYTTTEERDHSMEWIRRLWAYVLVVPVGSVKVTVTKDTLLETKRYSNNQQGHNVTYTVTINTSNLQNPTTFDTNDVLTQFQQLLPSATTSYLVTFPSGTIPTTLNVTIIDEIRSPQKISASDELTLQSFMVYETITFSYKTSQERNKILEVIRRAWEQALGRGAVSVDLIVHQDTPNPDDTHTITYVITILAQRNEWTIQQLETKFRQVLSSSNIPSVVTPDSSSTGSFTSPPADTGVRSFLFYDNIVLTYTTKTQLNSAVEVIRTTWQTVLGSNAFNVLVDLYETTDVSHQTSFSYTIRFTSQTQTDWDFDDLKAQFAKLVPTIKGDGFSATTAQTRSSDSDSDSDMTFSSQDIGAHQGGTEDKWHRRGSTSEASMKTSSVFNYFLDDAIVLDVSSDADRDAALDAIKRSWVRLLGDKATDVTISLNSDFKLTSSSRHNIHFHLMIVSNMAHFENDLEDIRSQFWSTISTSTNIFLQKAQRLLVLPFITGNLDSIKETMGGNSQISQSSTKDTSSDTDDSTEDTESSDTDTTSSDDKASQGASQTNGPTATTKQTTKKAVVSSGGSDQTASGSSSDKKKASYQVKEDSEATTASTDEDTDTDNSEESETTPSSDQAETTEESDETEETTPASTSGAKDTVNADNTTGSDDEEDTEEAETRGVTKPSFTINGKRTPKKGGRPGITRRTPKPTPTPTGTTQAAKPAAGHGHHGPQKTVKPVTTTTKAAAKPAPNPAQPAAKPAQKDITQESGDDTSNQESSDTTQNTQENTQGTTQENTQGNAQENTQGNTQENNQENTQGSTQENTQGGSQENTQGSTQDNTQESDNQQDDSSKTTNQDTATGTDTMRHRHRDEDRHRRSVEVHGNILVRYHDNHEREHAISEIKRYWIRSDTLGDIDDLQIDFDREVFPEFAQVGSDINVHELTYTITGTTRHHDLDEDRVKRDLVDLLVRKRLPFVVTRDNSDEEENHEIDGFTGMRTTQTGDNGASRNLKPSGSQNASTQLSGEVNAYIIQDQFRITGESGDVSAYLEQLQTLWLQIFGNDTDLVETAIYDDDTLDGENSKTHDVKYVVVVVSHQRTVDLQAAKAQFAKQRPQPKIDLVSKVPLPSTPASNAVVLLQSIPFSYSSDQQRDDFISGIETQWQTALGKSVQLVKVWLYDEAIIDASLDSSSNAKSSTTTSELSYALVIVGRTEILDASALKLQLEQYLLTKMITGSSCMKACAA